MVLSVSTWLTPPEVDPETVRLVAQCLNHYSTPGLLFIILFIIILYLGVTCASLMLVTPVLYIRLCDGAKLIQLYFLCTYTLTVHVVDGRVKGWCACTRSGSLVAGLRDICSKVADSNFYWKIRRPDWRFSKFLTHCTQTASFRYPILTKLPLVIVVLFTKCSCNQMDYCLQQSNIGFIFQWLLEDPHVFQCYRTVLFKLVCMRPGWITVIGDWRKLML